MRVCCEFWRPNALVRERFATESLELCAGEELLEYTGLRPLHGCVVVALFVRSTVFNEKCRCEWQAWPLQRLGGWLASALLAASAIHDCISMGSDEHGDLYSTPPR